MVRPKSFDLVLKELKERKQWEKKMEVQRATKKCSHCKGSMQALGHSNITGVCRICAHLAIIPQQ